MSWEKGSRRDFLGAAVAAPALGAVALADPGRAAAQAAGVKRGDLPDLTIKQIRVLVLKPEERSAPAGGRGGGGRGGGGRGGGGFAGPPGERTGEKLASIVTNSGIEGNYTLDDRYFHPNWSNLGGSSMPRPRGPARAYSTCRPSPRNGGPACAATASFPMPPPSTTAAGTSSARPSVSPSIASWARTATAFAPMPVPSICAPSRNSWPTSNMPCRTASPPIKSIRPAASGAGMTTSSTWRSSKPSGKPAATTCPCSTTR